MTLSSHANDVLVTSFLIVIGSGLLSEPLQRQEDKLLFHLELPCKGFRTRGRWSMHTTDGIDPHSPVFCFLLDPKTLGGDRSVGASCLKFLA